jgi:heptosyltransferase-3
VKLLIISSNLIGDTILSTGVIEYFKKSYPLAKFTFIIGPSAAQIYINFPNLDKIISIQKKKYNIHWLEIYQKCKNTKWDIIIDFRSSILSYFLKTKKKYIFKKNNKLNHIIQLNNFFKLEKTNLFIYTNKNEEKKVLDRLQDNTRYVIIFPGGNWSPKIWPSEKYNKLLNIIYYRYSNIKFVIVGSIKEKDKYLSSVIKNLPNDIFIDMMGESLTHTSAFMKKSNLFIGNDSGLMHLSVASNLNTIALFGPTNDIIYGHSNDNCFIVRTKESYEFFSKKGINEKISYMLSIEPEQILELIDKQNLL